MPETRGGRELDIEVVVAGRRSKEDAALESLTSAPTPSLTLSAPHIEQIIGWPAAGMPTRGNLTVTLKGRNFGLNSSTNNGPVTHRELKIGETLYSAEQLSTHLCCKSFTANIALERPFFGVAPHVNL